jgi:hypothetical protein
MRRLAVFTAVLAAAFAAQALADRGPPVDMTTHVLPDEQRIDMAGTVIASKPCRKARTFEISNRRLDGTTRAGSAFHATNKKGHFKGEVEFLYQGDGNNGDVPEGGGTVTYTLRAQRSRPQKDRFHAYNCPRIVHTEKVDIPPDPAAVEP